MRETMLALLAHCFAQLLDNGRSRDEVVSGVLTVYGDLEIRLRRSGTGFTGRLVFRDSWCFDFGAEVGAYAILMAVNDAAKRVAENEKKNGIPLFGPIQKHA